MSYCINPSCPKPQNTGKPLFCQGCGSELLLEGCYRVIHLLSDPNKPSGFGTIYEVDDCGTPKILKVLHNTLPKAVELFQQEAQVLSRLHHPGIPRVETGGYFTFSARNSHTPLHCLVMEKIEGLNLEEWLQARNNQPIGERAALRWLKQLAEILHEVHQQQYFHRDIKPPNIMLRPDGQLALIDFGTAREVTQTFVQKLQGQQVTGIISAGYTPREQMNGKAVPQSDFYALGRTFIYLLTGKFPNDFPEDSRTGELIWRDSATQASKPLADLIDYLTAPFPGNRPQDTQEILQRLTEIDRTVPSSQPSSGSKQQTPAPDYTGFWRRLLAYFIDIFILTIGTALLCKAVLSSMHILPDYIINQYGAFVFALTWAAFGTIGGVFGLLVIVFGSGALKPLIITIVSLGMILKWFYFTRLESLTKQATIGKMALGIVVTDSSGNRISFSQSNIRYWGKTVSTLIFLIGFIMAGVTKKKRALHDMIAGTLVVKKQR